MRSVSKSMAVTMIMDVGEGVEISKSVNLANLCLRWSLKKSGLHSLAKSIYVQQCIKYLLIIFRDNRFLSTIVTSL